MGEAPLLRVEGLVAGHRTAPVIGPMTFTLSPGEVIGLWGANGVGKSTLLNAIAGTARPFAGTIRRRPGLTLAYQEQRPARLPLMPMTGRDLLRAAGLERVWSRTFLVDRPAPLDDRTRRWVRGTVERFRHGLRDHLDAEDLATLDRLLDPADPLGLDRRQDLFLLTAKTVHFGRRPAVTG